MLLPVVCVFFFFFFFNDTSTTEIYTLSLHDALPISPCSTTTWRSTCGPWSSPSPTRPGSTSSSAIGARSEEHTSELQSRENLVCRLLLEKKKKKILTLYYERKKQKKKKNQINKNQK